MFKKLCVISVLFVATNVDAISLKNPFSLFGKTEIEEKQKEQLEAEAQRQDAERGIIYEDAIAGISDEDCLAGIHAAQAKKVLPEQKDADAELQKIEASAETLALKDELEKEEQNKRFLSMGLFVIAHQILLYLARPLAQVVEQAAEQI